MLTLYRTPHLLSSTSSSGISAFPNMFTYPLLLLCLLSVLDAPVIGQTAPILHPQPSSSSLYQSPSSPHDMRHLHSHLPHGQVQLRSAADHASPSDAMVTVAVEPSELSSSWYEPVALITGLAWSDSTSVVTEALGEREPSNETAAAYIVSMKSPTARRHQQLLADGIANSGYATLAYLPHNSFLVVPEAADANETAFVEWTLSSAHVQRVKQYAPQNKIDPLISQHSIHISCT